MTGLDDIFAGFARQLASARTPQSGRKAAAGLLLLTATAIVVALTDGAGAARTGNRTGTHAGSRAEIRARPQRLELRAAPPH